MRIINYKMTNRGLCCELNSLLGIYQEQRQLRDLIYVDSTDSVYFKGISIQDIFEFKDFPFVNSLPISNNHQIVSANDYRKYARKKYLFEIDSEEINKALKYTEDSKKIIQNNIDKLNLPKVYVCIHIRRGDKVLEKPQAPKMGNKPESLRYEFKDYFNAIGEKSKNVFIMSDDYKSIAEAKQYIQENNLNHKLFYLTNESQDGHCTEIDKDTNRIYTKLEILMFFTEIEIAKQSECFIGTKSSNVFRFIKATSSATLKFTTLD